MMNKIISIKDYYDNSNVNLFTSCAEIGSLGGMQKFDDLARLFYTKQYMIGRDIGDLKLAITTAWDSELYYIKKLYASMSVEYDPIENYHKTERTTTTTDTNKQTTKVHGASDNIYNYESTAESTSERFVSRQNTDSDDHITDMGYDKDSNVRLQNIAKYKDESPTAINGADAVTNIENETFGNIGVTSSQDLIIKEREVADLSYYKTVLERILNIAMVGVF